MCVPALYDAWREGRHRCLVRHAGEPQTQRGPAPWRPPGRLDDGRGFEFRLGSEAEGAERPRGLPTPRHCDVTN